MAQAQNGKPSAASDQTDSGATRRALNEADAADNGSSLVFPRPMPERDV
jgi:hypothetical protein